MGIIKADGKVAGGNFAHGKASLTPTGGIVNNT
jgi:hypothetical protein